MGQNKTTDRKWSGREILKRHELAAKLREYRRSLIPSVIWSGELSLVRSVVKAEFLAEEPDLVSTRWVEYGYMSALQCTELFCRLYLDSYKEHYGKYRDAATAATQKPVDPELFRNDKRQINSFWRARQHADRIGMPYGIFIRAAIDWGARQRNRKEFPAPNQLYGQAQLQEAMKEWEKWRGTTRIFTEEWDDRLFMGDSEVDPARKKALGLIRQRVIQAKNPDLSLAQLMGRSGAIGEDLARRLFRDKPGLVDAAVPRLAPPDKVRSDIAHKKYVPPCMGLVTDSGTVCPACPYRGMCVKLHGVTNALLVETTGSVDPRLEEKRRQARERKQNERRRKRDAALVAEKASKAGGEEDI